MRDSNGRPCPAVSELSTRANVGGEGERLPSCCGEAREADGGRRDTERQIVRRPPMLYGIQPAVVVFDTASTEST